jgi:hypothetical protein
VTISAPTRRCRDEPGLITIAVEERTVTTPSDITNSQVAGQRLGRLNITDEQIERMLREIEAAISGQVAPQPDGLLLTPTKIARVTAKQAAAILEGQLSPDGLKTAAQAAAKLNCSIKTLNGHVASGALRCVVIGHGTKRRRIRFTDADLDEFIINQTRRDTPCPSTASRARRTSTSNSESKIIAFTAAPKPRPGVKPKK